MTGSDALFERATAVLAGGVSSPVRAFGAVGGHPRFMRSGKGSRIVDVDSNQYLDLVMSWGPLIHGHAHPEIVEAVETAARGGTSFGAPTEIELELAEMVQTMMPALERLRFVSSGTEAAMSALRLARAFTGRDTIVKFDGCYHGHADALLVRAGSGALTFGEPTSLGIPGPVMADTRVVEYNDLDAFMDLMTREGEAVAAVIVEPVAGNMGTVPFEPGFLEGLRRETERCGALLIFDEVITGFRVGPGGVQGLTGIRPDLTCLGKIIGGGLPAAAFGGRREVMELLSPGGPVYQAGTLSGNPLAMAAGCASLRLTAGADYGRLEARALRLSAGLRSAAAKHSLPLTVNRYRSMLSLFFKAGPIVNLKTAQGSDSARYARFFHGMLDRGIYLPPSQFETWMLSFAHSDDDIAQVIGSTEEVFEELAEEAAGPERPVPGGG